MSNYSINNFPPFPLSIEFLKETVLSQTIVYIPIPKTEYYLLKNDIEEYKKQIDNLKKSNTQLKTNNFKLAKIIKKIKRMTKR
jgi:cell division protein FtsB